MFLHFQTWEVTEYFTEAEWGGGWPHVLLTQSELKL